MRRKSLQEENPKTGFYKQVHSPYEKRVQTIKIDPQPLLMQHGVGLLYYIVCVLERGKVLHN